MNKPKETISFDTSLNLSEDDKWTLESTSLEMPFIF